MILGRKFAVLLLTSWNAGVCVVSSLFGDGGTKDIVFPGGPTDSTLIKKVLPLLQRLMGSPVTQPAGIAAATSQPVLTPLELMLCCVCPFMSNDPACGDQHDIESALVLFDLSGYPHCITFYPRVTTLWPFVPPFAALATHCTTPPDHRNQASLVLYQWALTGQGR